MHRHRTAPELPPHKRYPILAALRVKVARVLSRGDRAAAAAHYPAPVAAVPADDDVYEEPAEPDPEALHALDAAGLVAECDESGEPRYVLPPAPARHAQHTPRPVLRPQTAATRGVFA